MANNTHTSKRLPEGVTVEQFVVAWQSSDNPREVAKKLGSRTPLDMSYLASFLRKRHNVPLKHFRKGKDSFDGATLRQLALENTPS